MKYFSEQAISFYPEFEVSAANKPLFEKSIREIMSLFSSAESDHFSAETYTGFFYNKEKLFLEIWDIDPNTFELVISHTKPLNHRPSVDLS
jgi:hypothetical protein